MTNHLRDLAKRIEDDPFFVACLLRQYARSEGLTDPALAAALGCSPESLVLVRLCRAPEPEAEQFQKDTAMIAERFDLHLDAFREAVRRGQVIQAMRGQQVVNEDQGTLLAARDGPRRNRRQPKQEDKS